MAIIRIGAVVYCLVNGRFSKKKTKKKKKKAIKEKYCMWFNVQIQSKSHYSSVIKFYKASITYILTLFGYVATE